MVVWPSIANPNEVEEIPAKPIRQETSSAGYTMSFARATTTKKTFNLSWLRMSVSDKENLDAFFGVYAGQSFTWINPLDSASYTMMFGQEEIRFKHRTGKYTASVTLKEA